MGYKNMAGKFIGIGVGPGDAELLTLKALRVLQSVPVVVHAHATGRPGIALGIVSGHVQENGVVIGIPIDMGGDDDIRKKAYDQAMPIIHDHLKAGQDVAFVCEGDALFYGSFQYVMERLSPEFDVEIIPGVSSINASAAAANLCIARGDETLHVLPATLPDGALAARLSDPHGSYVVIKLGRHLKRMKSLLTRLGRMDDAVLVEKATWDEERIVPLRDETGQDETGNAAYFSQILVPPCRHDNTLCTVNDVAIVCLNAASLDVAHRVQKAFPSSVIWGLSGRINVNKVDRVFTDVTETLQALFGAGTPVLACAASGIVIRALAPVLTTKTNDPPVVCMSPDGAFVVPLLGGHGGGNRLARAVSNVTQGFAAVTTAGDAVLGLALDEPPLGWHVENASAAKAVVAKMLSDVPVGVTVDSGNTDWLAQFTDGNDVWVSHKLVDDPEHKLILHPPTLSLGVGCARGCTVQELSRLVTKTMAEAHLSQDSIACVASIDVKSDEAAILALGKELGVPTRFFTAEQLDLETPRLKNPSDVVKAEVGCFGVCEGAALAVVGNGGKLLVEKQISTNQGGPGQATCAIGLSPTDIDPYRVGKGQGRLYIVGIGPGAAGWRTPEVTRILSKVSDVVGYGFYLDLVADLIKGKCHHTSNLSQEEARVRIALDVAATGKDVALISSGDVGIYAMAALAFELLDRENRSDWNRLYIQVEPGISAFQAAAARIGAPVGHDFCLISLSDLLTPWDVIERRLKAAAEGGFVVSLYNPVSKRRRTQLTKACEILLQHRKPDTPVILARQLGRADEDVKVITLAELTPDMVDMLTLVMIGGEATRKIVRGENTWVYTPRGYEKKIHECEKHEREGKDRP